MALQYAEGVERFRSFEEAWRWFEEGGEPAVADDRWAETWTGGRAQLLALIAPVVDQQVLEAIARMQERLAVVPGVVPFSIDYLHVTLLTLGFQVVRKTRDDEVTREEAVALAERAARLLHTEPPLGVALGQPNLLNEAIVCEVEDAGSVSGLACTLADALGLPSPEPMLPHVTIARCLAPVDRTALLDRMRALRGQQTQHPFKIRRIELARAWLLGGFPSEEPELDAVRTYVLRAGGSGG